MQGHRLARRGHDAADPAAQARRKARRRRDHRQGRGALADRLVQGARPRHGGVDGQGARHQAHGDAHQRQCRRGARGLCHLLRHQDHDLLSGRYARGERQRDRASGRDRLPRQRLYRRLRQDRRRGQGESRLVRHLDLEGADRIEGKKTMGLELAEQLGWDVPDVIFYPTGGGTGLIGMWKAFDELEKIGFIGSKRPRMVAVQASGCAPMVRAYEAGTEHATRWEDAHTIASGIRVPQAIGDFLILRAVRQSNGFAIAVDDDKISSALSEVAREEGLLLCPEGAATYAAYKDSLADGRVSKSDRVMLFNCATGLKYPLPPVTRTLDRHKPIDYSQF